MLTPPDPFPPEPLVEGRVLVLISEIARWAAGAERLAPEERIRAEAISHPATARAFVAGRALARTCMARLLGLAPGKIPIAIDERSKPTLALPTRLRFNLSHSDEHVALALTLGAEVGVDLEPTAPPDRDAVAEVVMTPAELEAFLAIPPDGRDAAFLKLWTRKEAVMKAGGTGFSVDPRLLTVGTGPIRGLVAMPGFAAPFALADLPGPIAAAVALHAPSVEATVVRA
ncbi:4'-phosphopantetheinyl transferase family protein [Alsobacter sp. SYSU BS001988]|jgi:4'-phosphopantetheinyl transferase